MHRELHHTLGYQDRPKILRVPTSCRCGGSEALVIQVYGTEEMVGCSCHYELVDYKDGGYWHVAVFELVEESG